MKNSIIAKVVVGICVVITVIVGISSLNLNVIHNKQEQKRVQEEQERQEQKEEMDLIKNDEKKGYYYKITTDAKYKTMRNDGGSHDNIYYKVDLENNKVVKYEDRYIGFKGYKYKNKIVYEKNISNTTKTKLKNIIEDLTTKKDINTNKTYNYYIIECGNVKKEIYNEDSIKLLENIFNVIDKQ